jgi:hypothetical protein
MEAQILEISAKLSEICEKLGKMEKIESRLERVESFLCELKHENTALREELASARSNLVNKDKTITNLSEQVNRLDQNARLTTIRVIGLPVTSNTPSVDIMKLVFSEIVAPCLDAAKAAGEMPTVVIQHPTFLIDSAFVIPSKKNAQPTVIVKFSAVQTRNIIFRFKKTALPKTQEGNRQRNKYAIYEDLSPATHATLNTFAADNRVKSVWSFNGQIRFKTHDSETMYKVKHHADTFDSIVKSASRHPPLMDT